MDTNFVILLQGISKNLPFFYAGLFAPLQSMPQGVIATGFYSCLLYFTEYWLPLRKFRAQMLYVTRIEHFNAAHKLYNPSWSREKNEEVFGKCANENWHGHNFELHVTLKGDADPETGFVFDVKKLSGIVKEHVTEKLDHKNLNMDVDFMRDTICSIENLVVGIWNQLEPNLPATVQLHCLKLYETPRIYVEYYGN